MTTERRAPVVGDTLRFWRTVNGGERGSILGHARLFSRGWKFYPSVASHKPSRKHHRTLEKCLPRWVGYPDSCESEYVQVRTTLPAAGTPVFALPADITPSQVGAFLDQIEKKLRD